MDRQCIMHPGAGHSRKRSWHEIPAFTCMAAWVVAWHRLWPMTEKGRAGCAARDFPSFSEVSVRHEPHRDERFRTACRPIRKLPPRVPFAVFTFRLVTGALAGMTLLLLALAFLARNACRICLRLGVAPYRLLFRRL